MVEGQVREETVDVEVMGFALPRDPPAPFFLPGVPTLTDGTEGVLKHGPILSAENASSKQPVPPEEVGEEPPVQLSGMAAALDHA